eukprot:scaffold30534_cov37-Cyclotella_meneghiniana.AAC.1
MNLFKCRSAGEWTERYRVEALVVEIGHDFRPKGDIIDPVVVGSFEARAIVYEYDAGRMRPVPKGKSDDILVLKLSGGGAGAVAGAPPPGGEFDAMGRRLDCTVRA